MIINIIKRTILTICQLRVDDSLVISDVLDLIAFGTAATATTNPLPQITTTRLKLFLDGHGFVGA